VTLPRISLDRAIHQFMAWATPKYAEWTNGSRRRTLRAFQRDCGLEWLDEIAPAHLASFLGGLTPPGKAYHASQNLRVFIRWCNDRFHLTVPLPDSHFYYERPGAARVAQRSHELEAEGLAIGRSLALPHQRLAFLLGFLYGWTLEKVRKVTLDEVMAVTPMRADLYALAGTVAAVSGSKWNEPLLRPWLLSSKRRAQHHWHLWAKVPFRVIQRAGNAARLNRGIRPIPLTTRTAADIWRLPAMDSTLVEKMPRVWEGL